MVSDNGPQFTAREFAECMEANDIRHVTSAPYHPATNGLAERFVQTFKRSLRAGVDKGTIPQKLAQFLLTYRATPHATTGVPPAELFLKRKLRTRLDLLKPSGEDRVHQKQQEQKRNHDRHTRLREFTVGQAVLVRNLRDGPNWLVGSVVKKCGPVNYEVEVEGRVWKRHADQLMEYKGQPVPPGSLADGSPAVAAHAEVVPELVGGDVEVELAEGPDMEVETPPAPEGEAPPVESIADGHVEQGHHERNAGDDVAPIADTTTGPVGEVIGAAAPPTPKTYPRRECKPPDTYEPTW